MPKIIIHSDKINGSLVQQLGGILNTDLVRELGFMWTKSEKSLSKQQRADLSAEYKVDVSILPNEFDPKNIKLLIMDMDSTLINIECVDEIADFLGIKPQVAAITESAMRGEIDFNTSLQKRVGLLKDLSSDVLLQVYEQRLKLNPGAEPLIAGLQQQGIKTALVSGGFTFFTERLKRRLAFDYTKANQLDVVDEKLSGKVMGPIVNASIKAQFLSQICQQIGIHTSQAIAMGDGANDLEMMQLAGLGVAYKAKLKVQEQADIMLNYSGLDSVLHLLA